MLDPPQDVMHLLAILDFSIEKIGFLFGILDCFSSYFRGL